VLIKILSKSIQLNKFLILIEKQQGDCVSVAAARSHPRPLIVFMLEGVWRTPEFATEWPLEVLRYLRPENR